jgi:hypothetical protein
VPPTPVGRPMMRRSRMMASCSTCWEVRDRCGYKTRLMRWDGSGGATTAASFENGVELADTSAYVEPDGDEIVHLTASCAEPPEPTSTG